MRCSFHRLFGFSEGFAPVQFQEKGKWGFIDKTGKIVIEPKFDEVTGFRQGTAMVTINNKFGYIIDKNEKFIWNPTN